jgi:hypothetical protein
MLIKSPDDKSRRPALLQDLQKSSLMQKGSLPPLIVGQT